VDRAVYGIPPEQVIGSRAKMKYELRGGVPVLLRLADVNWRVIYPEEARQ
jgi:hypothetical protein